MVRRVVVLSVMLLVAAAALAESIGLVLSGGGAKGIAHIGVIQALEDNDIPIDYVTGTSMGAIIGGLYAAGYTPQEMLGLIKSDGFANWSTGKIDNNLIYYFDKKEPTPAMFHLNFGSDSSDVKANILPSSLISPLPMNFAFMELFSPYTAQCKGNFDNLYVPFRCVAADVFNKRKLVMRSGSLGVAIRASMSFPIVFKPQYIDSVPVFDGGIYENFPVNVMREEFSPDFIIGVDVTAGGDETDVDNVIKQVQSMVVQDNGANIADDEGIRIDVSLKGFNLLDFPKADSIYRRGYEKALSMIDSIKGRTEKRISKESRALMRSIFKSKTPQVAFKSVDVTGGNKRQNDYLRSLFVKGSGDTLDLEGAQNAYYRAISSDRLNDFVPEATYDAHSGMFDLKLRADLKKPFSIGVGGWLSSSTNSMIFLSANYSTLSYNSFAASLQGWVGQSYYAGMLQAKFALQTGVPSCLKLEGVMSKQKYYESDALFYEDQLPTFIINYEKYVRLKYQVAVGKKSRFELAVGYGYLNDCFYPGNVVDFSSTLQDEASYKLGQVEVVFDNNSLNHDLYPTKGSRLKLRAAGVYGSSRYLNLANSVSATPIEDTNGWVEGDLWWDKYFDATDWLKLGLKAEAVVSNRPLGANYTASVVQAPAFTPVPSTRNYFNEAFRSNSYAAAGVMPVWAISDNLQLRTEFYAFAPLHKVVEDVDHTPRYSGWIDGLDYIGEVAAVYIFPFASLSIYCNYLSYPAGNWNFGINFGMLLHAPKFLR